MAVFVSASDENSGRDKRDPFLFAGWIGPESDWYNFFSPAWQERVLDGPPQIPYLHMTEMRSPHWQNLHGLTSLDANNRIDEAIKLLDTMATLFPICINVNAKHFLDNTKTMLIKPEPGRKKTKFEPDYISFLAYAFFVLNYVNTRHPEAEKVDFVVERNGKITKYVQEFHSHLAMNLRALGKASLAHLVGDMITAGKERVPLQAADVLCWYTARARKPKTMERADVRRYLKLLRHRKGVNYKFPQKQISTILGSLFRRAAEETEGS